MPSSSAARRPLHRTVQPPDHRRSASSTPAIRVVSAKTPQHQHKCGLRGAGRIVGPPLCCHTSDLKNNSVAAPPRPAGARMPILSELTLYPIKSCAGIALQEATLTREGLMTQQIYDREWMVVNPAGHCVTQREFPRMALIVPRLKTGTLELHAPGLASLEIDLAAPDPQHAPTITTQVWDDTVLAYDCDAATAAWISAAVGTPCRLVRFHAHAERKVIEKWTAGVAASTLFSDGYPVLVAGAASLADLNGRLVAAGRAALPMNRFRPNLVISGIEAYEEDYAESFQLGEVLLKPVKPCPRCPMPSVDQATGEVGPDPMDYMQGYRAKPELDGALCFGMNCIVVAGAGLRLKVGQRVDVTLAF